MEIANILSNNDLNIGPEFNVVKSIDDIVYNNLPLLVVGYTEAIELFGIDNINVLRRNVNKNVFWTFKKNVERNIYENDLEDFIIYSYKKATENINFIDLDLIQFSKSKIYKIVRKLFKLKNVISYKSEKNVVYIYSDNLIFIVDLNLLQYFGLNIDKVENKIKERSDKYISGNEILIEYNNHLDRLNHNYKLIPFLYSINPHD